MPDLKLTPARRRALDVLVRADVRGSDARVSNSTEEVRIQGYRPRFYVHWQTARWLLDAGLAIETVAPYARILITDLGREVAADAS